MNWVDFVLIRNVKKNNIFFVMMKIVNAMKIMNYVQKMELKLFWKKSHKNMHLNHRKWQYWKHKFLKSLHKLLIKLVNIKKLLKKVCKMI